MVFAGQSAVSEAYELLGSPKPGGIFIVVDHASNHVPADIDLGLSPADMERHIAWDIGVAAIAGLLVDRHGYAAILGGVSRLIADLNRYSDEDAVIPKQSDDVQIAANKLTEPEREDRLRRFYFPYHDKISDIISKNSPKILFSLHSFSSHLASDPNQKRPWDMGVMYNEDDRASRLGLEFLAGEPIMVGDQKPYSGKLLNATMNQHAESAYIPYIGVEIRQDHLKSDADITHWADRLHRMLCHIDARI